jgi:hypothetical protein
MSEPFTNTALHPRGLQSLKSVLLISKVFSGRNFLLTTKPAQQLYVPCDKPNGLDKVLACQDMTGLPVQIVQPNNP